MGVPEWLWDSGLAQTAGPGDWFVFLVILLGEDRKDAEGRFEISVAELASRTGLPEKRVVQGLNGLRVQGLIGIFIPEHPQEDCLIEIREPLPVNREMIAQVRKKHKGFLKFLDARTEHQKHWQELIEMWENLTAGAIGQYDLDILAQIIAKYEWEKIVRAFNAAKGSGARTLSWIIRYLDRIPLKSKDAK